MRIRYVELLDTTGVSERDSVPEKPTNAAQTQSVRQHRRRLMYEGTMHPMFTTRPTTAAPNATQCITICVLRRAAHSVANERTLWNSLFVKYCTGLKTRVRSTLLQCRREFVEVQNVPSIVQKKPLSINESFVFTPSISSLQLPLLGPAWMCAEICSMHNPSAVDSSRV